jgi:outer membrane lipoprotein
MTKPLHIGMVVIIAALLGACAAVPPFPQQALLKVDRTLTPELAARNAAHGIQVLWGGVIIGSINMPDHTDFNVLFYPLDRSQRPDLTKPPQNRYIVRNTGYLETMVYAPGREITVLGGLQGVEDGKVGDAPYRFPVVKADRIVLWPVDGDSRVHFGIGLGVGVHM